MAFRLTGMASGLDTETIIKELMASKSLKKTKLEQSKTKLDWKKEKWGELNTKLYNLFNKQVSKMRYQTTYFAKTAASSNESIATMTAKPTATTGNYTLKVSKVAAAQYLTSDKVKTESGGKVAVDTKLTDIDSDLIGKEIKIQNGDSTIMFQVRSDSTVNDYVDALKLAGLNASFDEDQQRFFISGKNSGERNAFSITTGTLTDTELNARSAIEQVLDYANMTGASKAIVNKAYQTLSELSTQPDGEEKQNGITAVIESLTDAGYEKQKTEITEEATKVLKAQLFNENYNEVKEAYYTDGEVKEEYVEKFGAQWDTLLPEEQAQIGGTREDYIKNSVDKLAASDTSRKVDQLIAGDTAVKERLENLKFDGISDLSGFSSEQVTEYGLKSFQGTKDLTRENLQNALTGVVNTYVNMAGDRTQAGDGTALNSLGMTDIVDGVAAGSGPSGMALVAAADSKIILNGAELTSSSTSVSVNGLTIDLKAETAENETITFTVSNDVSGVYNAVKDFIKEYNSVVEEMNRLYNGASSKGYEPLTDDQKAEMSESQIEQWEKKIKDSLLRRDSQLGDLMSGMRQALSSTVEVGGKRYSLSSFGIVTSPILAENGKLHLYGDSDDTTYAGEKDLLMSALQEDPEMVAQALSGIVSNLWKTMSDKAAGSKVKSAYTFYNDKQIDNDVKGYSDQIKEWTKRLKKQEDAYYKQFSAMETAMTRLNSQMSSLSSIFGN